jgi:glycerol uptake facilitator
VSIGTTSEGGGVAATTTAAPQEGHAWRRGDFGDYVAEFFGVFILIAFGTGVVAMAVAGLPGSGRGDGTISNGDWLLITWGWAMAVTFAIYVAGGITGAHINPAVTIAFAALGGFAWKKVPGYIVAQILGGVAGAALVYAVYRDSIQAYESQNDIVRDGGAGSIGIFVTGPAQYFGDYWGPFLTEVVGTAFLLLFVFAVVDLMNLPPKANLAPVVIGLAVFAIGNSFGANSGYAINPARDFGPRLLALFMGWGDAAFPGQQGNLDAYWWVPVVAPIIGGVIGAAFYRFIIADTLKARMHPADRDAISRGETVEDES